MYTDSLPATVMNAREEAAVIAQDLIVAADRYNLKDLKPVTENKLCKHSFSASTVLPMLLVAEHHQCWKLKDKCLVFIAAGRNTRAIMATDDVEHLEALSLCCQGSAHQDSGRKGGDAKQPSDGQRRCLLLHLCIDFHGALGLMCSWCVIPLKLVI